MNSATKKVCIIGAGPAGLVSARHISQCQNTEITVFEANSCVGGLWNYYEKNETDKNFDREKETDSYYRLNNCFHTSLYSHLESNIPHFFMGFKDFSHADAMRDLSVFINMSQHNKYLDAYAEKFDLKKLVVFNTLVKSVRLYDNLTPEMKAQVPEPRKFIVTTASSKGGDLESGLQVHSFDYVLVCTGHNSRPYIPEVKGISNFKGKVMAAKNYRDPNSEEFLDKRVLIVGASYSGVDLAVQLLANPYVQSQGVKKLTIVAQEVKGLQTAEDFEIYRKNGRLNAVKGEISEITEAGMVKLSDGSEHEIDTLVFCTGYEQNFSFLDFEKDKLIDFNRNAFRGSFIAPLYKRFICIREPDIFFMGLLDKSPLISLCAEATAMLAKAIIDGKYKLPPQNEMFQSCLEDIDEMKWKYKSLVSYLKVVPMLDVGYLTSIKKMIREVYPCNSEKAELFQNSIVATYMKMGTFFESANMLSYKKYDFFSIFDRNLKNTSEFV